MCIRDRLGINPSKVTFCVGLVCIGACGIITVGGSLAMFAEINGYIAANDYGDYQLAVIDLFKARFPSLILMMIYTVMIGHRFSPDHPVVATKSGEEIGARKMCIRDRVGAVCTSQGVYGQGIQPEAGAVRSDLRR